MIEQTGLEGSFPIGLIGSTYKAGDIYLEPLRARIALAAPSAQISQVEMPPAGRQPAARGGRVRDARSARL